MIFVIDLDGVINTYDNKLYPEALQVLNTLWKMNYKLYIASHNTEAPEVCEMHKITHMFKRILYGRDENKASMIKKIMDDNEGENVIFLDDQVFNLMLLEDIPNVECILIDEKYGLRFSDLAAVGHW